MKKLLSFLLLPLMFSVVVSSCSNRIPSTKKEIMDQFVAGKLYP
jgi:hypothetical protein